MHILMPILYTFIAGVINGSFAVPTKHIKQWNFENIWFIFSFWSFLILPWGIMLFLAPNVLGIYAGLPFKSLAILGLGGAGFGVGQLCFAEALKRIGLGLGFVINIGLGTSLGFLLPLVFLHSSQIFTTFGFVTLSGIAFIIIGLLISYKAGKERDLYKRHDSGTHSSHEYKLGVVLAIIAGIFSACQNFIFAATGEIQEYALKNGLSHLASAMIIWPVFLTFTFIPYAIYMLNLHIKHSSFGNYIGLRTFINIPIAAMMGFFWFFSLVLYSQSSLLLGSLGPVVNWPLFMVLIILTSNFWGWREKEWTDVTATIQRKALMSIVALVVAVAILAYSATISTHT